MLTDEELIWFKECYQLALKGPDDWGDGDQEKWEEMQIVVPNIFREAERGKGEARGFTPEEAQVHSDALRTTMTPTRRNLFSTPYADKVLEVIPWQKCPVCNGQGSVSSPPWAANGVPVSTSSAGPWKCECCQGLRVIAMIPNQAARKREEKTE